MRQNATWLLDSVKVDAKFSGRLKRLAKSQVKRNHGDPGHRRHGLHRKRNA